MIAVEVRTASGRWCSGFELVSFNPDGTATIYSTRTGTIRCLPQWQWRDPAELEALGAPCARG
jgi:hypothetical protein